MFNTLPYEPRKMSQLSWNALVVGKTCTASCRLWKKNATSHRFDENTGSEWEKCVSAYQCKRQTQIPEGRAFVVVRHIHTSSVWYDHAWIYFDKIAIPQYLCTPTTAHIHKRDILNWCYAVHRSSDTQSQYIALEVWNACINHNIVGAYN